MFAPNPKKEFVVNYDEQKVREAVLKVIASDNDYELVKDDKILNEIRFHQKGVLLDPGYHIDFSMTKVSDTETKVVVEVSRNLGAINTATEVSISNNSLKHVTSVFSAFLSGDVNAETGKPNIPQQGCVVLLFFMFSGFAGGTYAIVKLFFA